MRFLLLLIFIPVISLSGQEQRDSCECTLSCTTEEMIITAKKDGNAFVSLPLSLEERLLRISGVQVVNRGRMAKEILIRGAGDGQVTTSVDGMNVHGACVDKMDPITSYLETENLSEAVVDADAVNGLLAAGTVGAVNLITRKAEFNSPFTIRSEQIYSPGDRGVKSAWGISFGSESWAVRSSFTYRSAGNYYSGNGKEIAFSSYRKRNFYADAAVQLSSDKKLRVSFLGDYAADAGYPALVMDARSARAEITSVNLIGTDWGFFSLPMDIKLYKSSVTHKMDDFSRSTNEISSRIVMPGMYMPMAGVYNTRGIMFSGSTARQTLGFSYSLALTNDYTFSDMKMLALNPAVPAMYLYNIGGAEDNTVAAGGAVLISPEDDIFIRLAARLAYSGRTLNNTEALTVAKAFHSDYKDKLQYFIPSLSGEISKVFDEAAITGTVSYSARSPLLLENYGFFLFNPLSETYVYGSTVLQPEKSLRTGIKYKNHHNNFEWAASLYGVLLYDFIAAEKIQSGGGVSSLPEQRYINAGKAYMTGAELGIDWEGDLVAFSAKASVSYGYSSYFSDVLPFTPAPQCAIVLRSLNDKWNWSVTMNAVSDMENLSKIIAKEPHRAGYVLFNANTDYIINNNITLMVSVLNITGRNYSTGIGINNLSEPGTEYRIGMRSAVKITRE